MNGQLANEAILGEKPLVTFALFAYNQEKYIREAVEGALAQTYSPLQIILSDDCSTDKTFEIMEKITAQYAGPHEILLNRNKQNSGLAGHINYVMSLARGELIVMAAGDDISYAERTTKLYSFFESMDYPACIFSSLDEINNDGSLWIGEQVRQNEQTLSEFLLLPMIRGATCAYDKRVIEKFSKLNINLSAEDRVLPVRAYLLGRPPKMLNEKLIRYRRDEQRTKGSSKSSVKFFWQLWALYLSSKQHLIDVNCMDKIDADTYRSIYQYSRSEQVKFDVIQTKNIAEFAKKSCQCFKMFGVKQLIKLWVIKYLPLTPREARLLKLNR